MDLKLAIKNDNIAENNESFSLVIDSDTLPDGVTLGDHDTTVVTIINDDGKNK